MRIHFHNLEESDMAKDIVAERISDVVEKLPILQGHQVTVTLSMENSPVAPGPQSFTVKLRINGHRFSNLILTKRAESLYSALALVSDAMLERVQRVQGKNSKAHLRSRTRESLRRPAS